MERPSNSRSSAEHWIQLPGVEAASLRPGQARKVHLRRAEGAILELLLVRDEQGWTALDTLCPHAGGRFEEQLTESGVARCPLHDLRFDPRTGAAVDQACRPASAYAVRERAGRLEVALPFLARPLESARPRSADGSS